VRALVPRKLIFLLSRCFPPFQSPPNLPIQFIEFNEEKLDLESSLRAVARPWSFYKGYDFPHVFTQVSHFLRGEAKDSPYGYDKTRIFARTNGTGTENVPLLRVPEKNLPVLRISEDLSTLDPPDHDMVENSGSIKASQSWHGPSTTTSNHRL